jgi:16S rRNA (uracil1498-N3)-methyltransferase
MNLVLLEYEDFIRDGHVRIQGRRLEHVRRVHRTTVGNELRVGMTGGKIGFGRIDRLDDEALEMTVRFDAEPPEPLPVRLILALPRPKVLNRTIAAAVSMGIREIDVINSWRVEKAYWGTPKLSEANLRAQAVLGLEQSGDTILPTIRLHKLFVPFVREELSQAVGGRLAFVADPGGETPCPRAILEPVVIAIGPEAGFIEQELTTLRQIGFTTVSLGKRILRVETALAYLVGRLF